MTDKELKDDSNDSQAAFDDEESVSFNLLFVDDEVHILSALKRVFRGRTYNVMTALSAMEAISILELNKVDLIISDMRMPEVDGSALLGIVAKRWPETVRILLTGYADLNSTIAAVNEGNIYRYISKPWDDDDIKNAVNQGLEILKLKRERVLLEKLTVKQNAQLKELNENLELKVDQRTGELQQAVSFLELSQQTLNDSHVKIMLLLSGVVESRRGMRRGHAKRVADLSVVIAERLGHNEDQIRDVRFAALVHEIGTVSLPVNVFAQPSSALDKNELKERQNVPLLGESLLMNLDTLDNVARIVRSHCENFDGSGYPDSLKGEAIPVGARIVHAVNVFYRLREGRETDMAMSKEESISFLIKNSGSYFDSKIVNLIRELLKVQDLKKETTVSVPCPTKDLKVGMVLSQTLLVNDGLLLLSENQVITEGMIKKLLKFEKSVGIVLDTHVYQNVIKKVNM